MKKFFRLILARLLASWFRFNGKHHELMTGSVLIFAPHADDETLGCGGLIAARTTRALPVHVSFITDSGGTSANESDRRALSLTRQAEALAAIQALQLNNKSVSFLNAPDGRLPLLSPAEIQVLTERIHGVVRACSPLAIYLPFSGSHSTEHEAAHHLIRSALQSMDWHGQLWEYPVWAWWNPLRFARHALRKPAPCFLRLGLLLAQKQMALRCHTSQHEPGSALPPILSRLCLGPWEFFFPIKQPPES